MTMLVWSFLIGHEVTYAVRHFHPVIVFYVLLLWHQLTLDCISSCSHPQIFFSPDVVVTDPVSAGCYLWLHVHLFQLRRKTRIVRETELGLGCGGAVATPLRWICPVVVSPGPWHVGRFILKVSDGVGWRLILWLWRHFVEPVQLRLPSCRSWDSSWIYPHLHVMLPIAKL